MQVSQAFFFRCASEIYECEFGRGDGPPRVLFVSERDASDDFPGGRFDDVHDLSAMELDELPIDVVRRDFFDRVFLHDGFRSALLLISVYRRASRPVARQSAYPRIQNHSDMLAMAALPRIRVSPGVREMLRSHTCRIRGQLLSS